MFFLWLFEEGNLEIMKNIFLLLLVFWTLSISAQSFDYFAHNPRWVERYQIHGEGRDTELYIEGDSLHDGVLYHKLWITGYTPPDDRRIGFPRVQGLIRQDGYKVRYKGFITSVDASHHQPMPLTNADTFPDEFLLFDFGMEVGDTLFTKDLPTIGPEYDHEYYILGAIDSGEYYQPIPNKWGRVLLFSSRDASETIFDFVEGIGTLNSFLGRPIEGCVESCDYLSCYNNNFTQQVFHGYRYGPSQQNCSGSVESVNEMEVSTNAIYPKPSTGTLLFNAVLPTAVKVYNALGQLVLSEANPYGISSISLDGKPSGYYNVQYQTKGKWFVEKVVLE